MANVNKKKAIADQQGLPTIEAIMTHQGGDNMVVPSQNIDGTQAPVALTEGEFVFSIPAIVALGEGDYEVGMATLEELHGQLKMMGDQMIGETAAPAMGQGLANVPME